MTPRHVRRGLRLALGLLAGAAAAPGPALADADACRLMPAAALEQRLAGASDRYEFRDEGALPFLALWHAHRPAPLPADPDAVAVFAVRGRPLLVAYRRGGCVVGLLPVARDEVWAALRRMVGPVA